jgi:hypothetical protein
VTEVSFQVPVAFTATIKLSGIVLELVQRHIDPVTRARSTGRKAAKGANAPPIGLTDHSELLNHITNPYSGQLHTPDPGFISLGGGARTG